MIRFGGDKFKNLFETWEMHRLNLNGNKIHYTGTKRVEGYNYDVRKQLLDYDDVLRKQREIMYEQRNYVLEMKMYMVSFVI